MEGEDSQASGLDAIEDMEQQLADAGGRFLWKDAWEVRGFCPGPARRGVLVPVNPGPMVVHRCSS